MAAVSKSGSKRIPAAAGFSWMLLWPGNEEATQGSRLKREPPLRDLERRLAQLMGKELASEIEARCGVGIVA